MRQQVDVNAAWEAEHEQIIRNESGAPKEGRKRRHLELNPALDFNALIAENKMRICGMSDCNGVVFKEAIEVLVSELRAQWERLTPEQRNEWTVWKIGNFQARGAELRPMDVVTSSEMRSIPTKHGACHICYEEGVNVILDSVK
jgi:hypothetical protein